MHHLCPSHVVCALLCSGLSPVRQLCIPAPVLWSTRFRLIRNNPITRSEQEIESVSDGARGHLPRNVSSEWSYCDPDGVGIVSGLGHMVIGDQRDRRLEVSEPVTFQCVVIAQVIALLHIKVCPTLIGAYLCPHHYTCGALPLTSLTWYISWKPWHSQALPPVWPPSRGSGLGSMTRPQFQPRPPIF